MTRGETRPALIRAGLARMLAQGYSATSIDQVCGEAGVSKGSFYHFFGSKEEFGLAVLEAFYERGIARVRSGEFTQLADPLERLRGFFRHMEEIAPELWRDGCLLGTFATELAESNPAIHARVAQLFDRLAGEVAPLFAPVLGDAEQARSAAEELLAAVEGSVIMARAYGDPDRIAEGIRRFRRSVAARVDGLKEAAAAE